MRNLSAAQDGKTNAIIGHFTIIGTIIAIVLNNNSKNEFTSFYIRQMIGLHILSFVNGWIVSQYIGGWAGTIIGILIFAFWLISFIGAINEQEKLIPFLGEQFQEWFKGIQ
ncbi:hypothetical protein SAMN04489761_0175 [Tenacibaculum sp. MAR_2009_124]|uniref:hypothetical protein n=1 Tax=Tenacibaculum sp. MAR_2009_124 TaxID=1250059 RepID=UPI00089A2980|nr:hypothetical protein [Tenacibaculum sp. MAR_2009_124]SEB36612.1 hypothetical protein SAMN04489761_0175 [Tenacibaculum sp. MAR_2009_124]